VNSAIRTQITLSTALCKAGLFKNFGILIFSHSHSQWVSAWIYARHADRQARFYGHLTTAVCPPSRPPLHRLPPRFLFLYSGPVEMACYCTTRYGDCTAPKIRPSIQIAGVWWRSTAGSRRHAMVKYEGCWRRRLESPKIANRIKSPIASSQIESFGAWIESQCALNRDLNRIAIWFCHHWSTACGIFSLYAVVILKTCEIIVTWKYIAHLNNKHGLNYNYNHVTTQKVNETSAKYTVYRNGSSWLL